MLKVNGCKNVFHREDDETVDYSMKSEVYRSRRLKIQAGPDIRIPKGGIFVIRISEPGFSTDFLCGYLRASSATDCRGGEDAQKASVQGTFPCPYPLVRIVFLRSLFL